MTEHCAPDADGSKSLPALELVHVRKSYGEVAALHEISLSVAEGTLLFLLGPSGCGKTTTLRIVAGFIRQEAGQVRIRGDSVDGIPPERRNLGMVFQNYALFPHMTVFQNVAFGLRMRRIPAEASRQRVRRALDLVQLGEFEERYPRELSGGQQQRVALARAIVIEPKLLLLDEPLSNLDLKLREQMRSEIRALQRSLRITTIFVTHDQEEAITMGDEIVVMNQGRIVQCGTPAALYDRPVNRFVAHFIGESNLESGKVLEAVAPSTWRVDAGGLPVLATGRGPWHAGDAVAVAVRPEKIRLAALMPGGTDAPNRFVGSVEECIFRGALRRYRVRLPHGHLWNVDEPSTTGTPALEVTATIRVQWRPEDCLVIADS
jgi:putative spermidine/putrescine transport system ATP-binding protein